MNETDLDDVKKIKDLLEKEGEAYEARIAWENESSLSENVTMIYLNLPVGTPTEGFSSDSTWTGATYPNHHHMGT